MIAFLRREVGGRQLPFEVIVSRKPFGAVPHIDLVKLFWLMSAVAPACLDIAFFAESAHIDFGVSSRLEMHFETKSNNADRTTPGMPKLFEIIRNNTKDLPCDMHLSRNIIDFLV